MKKTYVYKGETFVFYEPGEINSETFEERFKELRGVMPVYTLERIKGYFYMYLGMWKSAKQHERGKGIKDGLTRERLDKIGEKFRMQASEALFDWLFEAFVMTDEAKAAGLTTKKHRHEISGIY